MKRILYIISAAVIISSCGNKTEGDAKVKDSVAVKSPLANPNSKESVLKKINYWDSITRKPGQTVPDRNVNIYSDQQSIVLIDNCLKSYPNHPEKIQLLFWKAMVLDDRLNDKDRAKLVYEQIIKEYPGTPAADQAKDAMKWSGKTDLEMIREMEKKNGVK
jgi:hypothetical protein